MKENRIEANNEQGITNDNTNLWTDLFRNGGELVLTTNSQERQTGKKQARNETNKMKKCTFWVKK